jgi:hypothetical protein
MNEQELKEFADLEESLAKYIGKIVNITNDFGWVRGRLNWTDSYWKVSGEHICWVFDTDDVKYVSENSIFFHSSKD